MSTTSTPHGFLTAFRAHPAGVALVTADAGNGPVALTATSVASISVDPPILMFSISDSSSSSPTVAAADTVVVHLLTAGQLHLAKLGATSGIDRFADTSLWRTLPTGEAVFPQAPVQIRAQVTERVRAGTAHVVIARALEVTGPGVTNPDNTDPEARHPGPLVYHDRTWHHLGESSRLD